MTVTKATDALNLLIEYQRDMFTKNIIDDMDEFQNGSESSKLTNRALSEAEPAIVKTIERLCNLPTPFSVNSYFQSVPETIRFGVLLRFQYFEELLRSYGDGYVELPSDFQEFLKYGLVDLWNQRQELRPRFRQN